MSTTIEFDRVAFSFDGNAAQQAIKAALPEDGVYRHQEVISAPVLYTVFVQQGANNSIETFTKNGREYQRVARSWEMAMLGSEYQVIDKAIDFASYANSGMTRFESGDVTPEGYIQAYRKALKAATKGGDILMGSSIRFTAPEEEVRALRWLCHAEKQGRLSNTPPRYGDGTTSVRDWSLHLSERAEIDADIAALAAFSREHIGYQWFSPSSGLIDRIQRVSQDRADQRRINTRHVVHVKAGAAGGGLWR